MYDSIFISNHLKLKIIYYNLDANENESEKKFNLIFFQKFIRR